MKQDRFSFPLVSAVILAGVILALVGPIHNAQPPAQPAAVAPPAGAGE